MNKQVKINLAQETRKVAVGKSVSPGKFLIKFHGNSSVDDLFQETSDPIHTILSNDGLDVEYIIELERGNVTQYWLTEIEDHRRENSREETSSEWSRDKTRRHYEERL